jgi:hypothetical protein
MDLSPAGIRNGIPLLYDQRPLINQYLDEEWLPKLQTPPFPEYTSGHSVISRSAATVLTKIYGDNFAFDDTTEEAYGLPTRSYKSFMHASEEAGCFSTLRWYPLP